MKELRFSRLQLHAAPGFEGTGFTLEDLDSPIVLIHGPNAAGKTTAARVMKLLLWPQHMQKQEYAEKVSSEAVLESRSFSGSNDRWFIEFSRAQARYQHNGADITRPDAFLPSELSERYSLSLHELLTRDNRSFARLIQREAVGGYDLNRLALDAEASPALSSRQIGEYKDYQAAARRLKELKQHEAALQAEEKQLGELFEQEKLAEAAAVEARLYQDLRAVRQEKAVLEDLEQRLAELSPALRSLREDDLETARERVREIERQRQLMERELRKAAEHALAVQQLNFTPSPDFPLLLETWESEMQELQRLHNSIDQLAAASSAAKARVRERRSRLGVSSQQTGVSGLNAEDLTSVIALSRRTEELFVAAEALEEELRLLEQMQEDGSESRDERTPALPNDPEALRQARRTGIELKEALQHHLHIGWTASAFILISGAYLLSFVHIPAAVSAAAAALLSLAAAILQPALRAKRRRLIGTLRTLGVDTRLFPLKTADDLSQLLELILKAEADASFRSSARQRMTLIRAKRERVRQEERTAAEELEEFRSRAGSAPDFTASAHGLSWFIEGMLALQSAADELSAAAAQQERLEENFRERRSALHKAWQPWRGEASAAEGSLAGMNAALKELKKRYSEFCRLTDEERQAVQNGEQHRLQREEALRQLRNLCSRIGIDPEEEPLAELEILSRGLPAFISLEKQLQESSWHYGSLLKRLHENPQYSDELLGLDLPIVEERLRACTRTAEAARTIRERITKAETAVEIEKDRRDIEEALAERDAAADRLSRRRARNLQSIISSLLITRLQRRAAGHDRPEVFHAADALFTRLTLGRFSLELAGKDEPAFRARDTKSGRSLSLDELSSATRVQLLLAVRIAFVSVSEQELRLPLFVDEALANSDDIRSREVIEALIRISEEGRQVFYFTAQSDEAARWREVLQKQEKTAYLRVIELPVQGESGQQPHYDERAGSLYDPQRSRPVIPSGMSHEDLFSRLSLTPFDLLHAPVSALHIWYLLEDTELITWLLARDISALGPLEAYVKHGGVLPFSSPAQAGAFERTLTELRDLAEQAVKLARTGLDKPFPLTILQDSEIFTPAFAAQLTEIHRETGGDPQSLLERAAALPRMKKARIEQFQEFLMDGGYLTRTPSLPARELEASISAHISRLEHVDEETARRFIRRLLSGKEQIIPG